MKVFISQGMRGKTEEEILKRRSAAEKWMKEKFPEDNIEILDTFFKDFNGNRLQFLGKSIMDGLAKAHVCLMVDDWQNYSGCVCEHNVANNYDVPIFYFGREEIKSRLPESRA